MEKELFYCSQMMSLPCGEQEAITGFRKGGCIAVGSRAWWVLRAGAGRLRGDSLVPRFLRK